MLNLLKSTALKVEKLYSLNFIGVIVGLLGFLAAVAPSLLPRPPFFIGVLAGWGFMVGYGFGILGQKIYYWVIDKKIPKKASLKAKKILAWSSLVFIVFFSILSQYWQNDVRDLLGTPHSTSFSTLLVIFAFVFMGTLVLIISRGLQKLYLKSKRRFSHTPKLPRRLSVLIGTTIAIVIVFFVVDGVALNGFNTIANSYYRMLNNRTDSNATKPTSALRSGSDVSLVEWDTLGRQGRNFVSGGPSAKEISEFTHQAAKEPIRVYIGAGQADTANSRAELAVKELERTKAFERKFIIVSTTTGSGWIDPASADAPDYLTHGDIAQVTAQYSYLPSWLALLTAKDAATDAGRALFNAVYERVQQIPAESRPKIVLYGLSLGAFGGQSDFASARDFAASTDGALFQGGPGFSEPWRHFTANRDAGSPEIKPIFQNGRTIRFANDAKDLETIGENWQGSRILYVQYPTDPIVWWSPSLLWHKPDWLSEPRGEGVTKNLQWIPVITFLQLTVDQFFTHSVPSGHGHNYAPDAAASWNAVLPQKAWTNEKTAELQTLLDKIHPTRYNSSISE